MLTLCRRFGTMLFIFEDRKAVKKVNTKGRSATMRHESRTHRVAPKIQVKYVDTKHHFADEWNNLLCLFNMSHFSSLCCAQNFSLTSCTKTLAKRMQEREGEDRTVAMSKADDDEPGFLCLDKFFDCRVRLRRKAR